MARQIKIGSKITVMVLTVVLIAILVISFIAYDLNRKAAEARGLERVQLMANAKTEQITAFFRQIETTLRLTSQLSSITEITQDTLLAQEKINALFEPIKQTSRVTHVYLLDETGATRYQDETVDAQRVAAWIKPHLGSSTEQKVYYSPVFSAGKSYSLFAAAPVSGSANWVVFEVDMESVYRISQDTTGLGKTGETVLAASFGGKLVYLNALRNAATKPLKEVIIQSDAEYGIQQTIKGKTNQGIDKDYLNQPVLAAWQPLPYTHWGLVTKINIDEVYEPVHALRKYFFWIGLGVLLGSLVIGIIFSHFLINPLLSLKSAMRLLGKGILPERLLASSRDEIGEMTDTVNNLVEGLKKTADFAHKIGEGNYEADFQPMSQDDMLGKSLLNMRDSIQQSAWRDDEQKWIVTGIAEIGDILRSTNAIEELSERVITYLTKKIDAIQGAFYVVNDEDEANRLLEMTASYAYHKKKYLSARFRFAEGLVGQAAIEQDTILRTEVPGNYVTITSGLLGDKKPSCILIVPLITVMGSERVVYGVLEFAGFEKFGPRTVRFVNEVSEIIARTVFNIKVNETTRTLLEKSQVQSEELQEQQEVLRQNAEEMQSTQEELKRANHALEEQIEEVNRAQKRMQVLLENASEVITIYEQDRRIRYVSPSVEKILGYTPEEMRGMNDIVYVHEAGVDAVDNMFRSLIENPEEQITIQFSYQRKDGDRVWLEATGTNLLADSAIEGIVVNTRDITERLRAQKEERMRGQMQALSENSPDLITRFNREGEVFYINPIIELYTGNRKEDFLKKSIDDVPLNESVINFWLQLLQDALVNQEKIATEMDFPSVMGKRVMQVNAIPEYNDQGTVESVLVVSHDITDRKVIELEIQSKNKKITESINYAKRIQGAILPNNFIIQEVLPESFILYKPRDVVSGDFPWFLQKGDDLYIAAVDCTGHGVPGALISLIGYFLLNNIVNNKDVSAPGEVLDLLDQGVTHTLKQDNSDSSSRDGMDIALCKINLKKKTLQYAGAHRPLYSLHGSELTEVKGDKFPIGGGQYKGRTSFKTTTLKIQPGDSVYFCSDGFPDQFGGPENRKFSPKKIREIITGNAGLSMQQMHSVFDQEFEAWKGSEKQTDDVLMIGIRF